LREKIRIWVMLKSRRLGGMRRRGRVVEDAMLRVRIAATSASCLIALGLAAGSASAQSTPTAAPGAPLPLLQFLQQKKNTAKPAPHPRLAAKVHPRLQVKFAEASAKRRIAEHPVAVAGKTTVEAPQNPAPPAAAAAPIQNMWPTADATAAPGTTSALEPPAPTAVSTAPVVETNPNEIVVDGHSVQVASPDSVNPIDLAADGQHDAENPANGAKAAGAASPDPAQPVVHAMIATVEPAADDPAPVGSFSWIAHVLAALGGAVAAGAVAWFLIGPLPRRNYG
jgi:hypothetical protein